MIFWPRIDGGWRWLRCWRGRDRQGRCRIGGWGRNDQRRQADRGAAAFGDGQAADTAGFFASGANQFIIFGTDEQLVGADEQTERQPRPAIQNPAAEEIHVNEAEKPG